MTRRCSHCSNNGHNSRTCPWRGGVKLFGVRLTDGSIKKSASMSNLSYSSSAAASPNPSSPFSDPVHDHDHDPTPIPEGYASDDPAHASCSSNCRADRKKVAFAIVLPHNYGVPGVPWTEEEHRLFLMGLQRLGKGDWRGIARNFVMSRTPTQVASHAQKHFIRQSNVTRRKRRSSLFDMVPDMCMDPSPMSEEQFLLHSTQNGEAENVNLLPSVNLSLNLECEPMEAMSSETPTEAKETESPDNCTPMVPAFFPTYLPVPFSFWTPNLAPDGEEKGSETSQHQVVKPIPILSKEPVNADELVGISQLSIGEVAGGRIEPSPLSLKLLGTPSRLSAFHANAPVSRSDLSESNSSVIHAV
ncbi:hypothetical protein HHK36_006221 [Tetracentron sinense]|uniref:Uncharacterized protein n=1 Tax=Tetracentron sinense TaxID=13715 RepID=A0A834ZHN3_TETSI|nr:hypothetical protein HHK36_006221 [Tetracentron sinense]